MSHAACLQSPAALALDCPDRLRLWHPRFQPCAVCLRPAQGFGFFKPNTPRPREHRWFCSMPCQAWFAARYRKGLKMQGMTEEEHLALALVMKRLGQTMEAIGWQICATLIRATSRRSGASSSAPTASAPIAPIGMWAG